MKSEVVVVGGGVVGAAATYQLARLGANVTLVDAENEGHATAAGAGIISPGSSYRPPAPYYPLSYKSASYYPTLLGQLSEDGANECGYEVVGGLYVATTEEEASRLALIERLLQDRESAGVPNIGTISLIDREEAKQLFPAIGNIQAAIHISDSARLNGRLLRDSLKKAARTRGADIVTGTAKLVCESGYVKGVEVAGSVIAADVVVVAGGAWSNGFKEATGIEVPVKPQKGQILHLELTENTSKWPIILGFHSHYMLTFPDHRIVVGATREDDSGYDTRVTAAGIQELVGEALRVAPGLADASIVEVRVGLRPDTPDHLPILGPVPGIHGLYLATGHGANGLTAGAYSGIAVADQVLGKPTEVDLKPFSVTRFF
ncbi:NAD(P)/FAD-dependent oxidoreductase [Alicyclobacillus dauci]|uniref:FAD-binding oxidoreductase n=1 Tax=Alicyclobacillus dauci TaxID=1475485 RepID=A0ABY6Z4P4_9BACL|nr:FAD-dependent oxidoreductase [Alicyclobacillus dauci]WAH37735.1 FAD-binding oxidoreductase [Alicyclobacillus dauci]